METRRIAVGPVELSYNEVDGEGRPFVLLHGLTGHRDDFLQRMPELADVGRLLAPDLRGHGDFTHTGSQEACTFAQLVADLHALLGAWDVERCDLLGHSFGGMLALRFTLEHPERIASLLLMDTAPMAPERYNRDTFERAGSIARARGMAFLQQLVEKVMRRDLAPSPSDRATALWGDYYWEHMKKRYTAMDPVAYEALGIAMVEQVPVVDRLAEIGCPTSVLVGVDDTEFVKGADVLEAGIPGAVRVTIPDAGHHPQMENPEAWSAAVRAHLLRAR